MADEKLVEKRINEFFESYGTEGFLRLYFTNYLFELVLHYIRTEDAENIEFDSSYRYHFHEDGLVTPEKEEEFRRDIRRECAKKADDIVRILKRRKLIDKIPLSFSDERVAKLIQTSLEKILQKISIAKRGGGQ